jgi:hypothetical protein
MNGPTRIFVNVLLLSVASTTTAPKPSNTIDLSVIFGEVHANAPVGGLFHQSWFGNDVRLTALTFRSSIAY